VGLEERERNKAVVGRLVQEVLAGRDAEPLTGLLADEPAVWESFGARLADLGAFPSYELTLESLTAEGDHVAARSTLRGRQLGRLGWLAPTGRNVTLTLFDLFRLRDGRVVESWRSWERQALLAELAAAPPEPVLELDEIQGNILPGFLKDYQVVVCFRIEDVERARAFLHDLAPHVASAAEVLQFNRLFSASRRRRGHEAAVRATWTNVALSFDALRRLAGEADFGDTAFREGMAARAELLGDPDPGQWVVGSPAETVDGVVIVASDDDDDLADELERIDSLAQGVRVVWRAEGRTLPEPWTGREHYGFRDGISQPALRGLLSADPDDVLTPRRNPDDPNEADPGTRLVWPGEFVFGYPTQDAADPLQPGPPAQAGPDWARNGSYVVFRRYRQDPARFQAFVEATAAQAGLAPELLAGKLVGRWRSGAPLSRAPDVDDPALGADGCANNNFAFARARAPIAAAGPGTCSDDVFPPAPADPEGVRCPQAAHIRKSYPRDEAESQTHRLLRRGIPFGSPDDPERGLLFFCYQTSIERQFEFVVRNWIDNPDFRRPGEGLDPIVGSAGAGAAFALPGESGAAAPLPLPLDWTTMTGGAYFFAPSISALSRL
jgi:Dyp-type peroxidase family